MSADFGRWPSQWGMALPGRKQQPTKQESQIDPTQTFRPIGLNVSCRAKTSRLVGPAYTSGFSHFRIFGASENGRPGRSRHATIGPVREAGSAHLGPPMSLRTP